LGASRKEKQNSTTTFVKKKKKSTTTTLRKGKICSYNKGATHINKEYFNSEGYIEIYVFYFLAELSHPKNPRRDYRWF
jgi:hypothetical protein